MENDKATAWLTLADADAVEQKVVDVIRQLLEGGTQESRQNLNDLGSRLGYSYTLANMVFNNLQQQIQSMLQNEICNNLRMDMYIDQYNQNLHVRLNYKGNGVTQQTINLRGL